MCLIYGWALHILTRNRWPAMLTLNHLLRTIMTCPAIIKISRWVLVVSKSTLKFMHEVFLQSIISKLCTWLMHIRKKRHHAESMLILRSSALFMKIMAVTSSTSVIVCGCANKTSLNKVLISKENLKMNSTIFKYCWQVRKIRYIIWGSADYS